MTSKIKKIDLSKVYKPRAARKRPERGYHTAKSVQRTKTAAQFGWETLEGHAGKYEFTFSVIMPAYNSRDYITRAMDSVIGQTSEEPLELIVVDDCSTDDTFEIISDYVRRNPSTPERCITVLRNNKNSGVAYSRNQGIKRARGEYIAFLDSDDWWHEDKLRLQFNHLYEQCERITKEKERAEIAGKKIRVRYPVLSCTARELADDAGNFVKKLIGVPPVISYEMLLKTNHIPCSSVLVKSEVAKEFPMHHDELHEDYLTWLSITKKYGPAIGLNEPLLYSRQSYGGKSRNKFRSAIMQYRTYRYLRLSPPKAFRYMMDYIFEGIQKYS